MAQNQAPATVTITAPIGAGGQVTAQKFTDVTDFEVDFIHNLIKVNRTGSGSSQIYAYDGMNTCTWTISAGVTAIVISS
jgi:hypothetical protein